MRRLLVRSAAIAAVAVVAAATAPTTIAGMIWGLSAVHMR